MNPSDMELHTQEWRSQNYTRFCLGIQGVGCMGWRGGRHWHGAGDNNTMPRAGLLDVLSHKGPGRGPGGVGDGGVGLFVS